LSETFALSARNSASFSTNRPYSHSAIGAKSYM
jgi:hypothetical protein